MNSNGKIEPEEVWTLDASSLGFDVHQALGLDDEDGDILGGIHRLVDRVAAIEDELLACEDHGAFCRLQVRVLDQRANGNAKEDSDVPPT